MLYNSYIFLFLFLPVTLFGFHFLTKFGHYKLTVSWLVAASLFFYGWWNPIYIALLIGSAIFNFLAKGPKIIFGTLQKIGSAFRGLGKFLGRFFGVFKAVF